MKKSTDPEVGQAKYEVEAAQAAYYKSLYDVIIWQDILDKGIYGAVNQ